MCKIVGSPLLTWAQFSRFFVEHFEPRTRKNEFRRKSEYLLQGPMYVTEYEIRFTDLFYHGTSLIPTEKKRVGIFIDSLLHGISLAMGREVETGTSFHHVVGIVCRVEPIRIEFGEMMQGRDKKYQHLGSFNGASSKDRGRFRGSQSSSQLIMHHHPVVEILFNIHLLHF